VKTENREDRTTMVEIIFYFYQFISTHYYSS